MRMVENSIRTKMQLPKAHPRRTHQKSRNGCVQCKRRKIKCDEEKPQCARCISFRIPCSFSPTPATGASGQPPSNPDRSTQTDLGKEGQKIRGRPRKDWSAIELTLRQCSSSLDSAPSLVDHPPPILDIDQAELLHHFTTCTGPTLANPDNRDDPITHFWSHNAPLVGCSSPAVLHLCLGLAARHLLYLNAGLHRQNPAHYISLAERHFAAGLLKVNEALRNVGPATSGAAYLSTVLLCYCTFATGPSGPKDFLVCDLSTQSPVRWLSIAKGTALLRQTFDPDTLFAGLMSPFNNPYKESEDDLRPTCECQHFPRLEWSGPLEELRSWVVLCGGEDLDVLLESLDVLEKIYEATFGDDQGDFKCTPNYKMVFIWLYVMNDLFLSCLRKTDNCLALLLVGYYAPLLKTMRGAWYIHGWAEHITAALELEIKGSHARFVEWPSQAIKLLEGSNSAEKT